MRNHSGIVILLSLGMGLAGLGSWAWLPAQTAGAQEPAAEQAASLQRPDWHVGDTWVIETLTERVQGRETKCAGKPARIRWKFHVAKLEKLAGVECYRIDIECLAAGRLRPKTTIWCDKETLFLRQFQTQLAAGGRYRTIQESYDCPKGQYAPVLASLNVLPIGLPAFVPKGAKGGDTFTYNSQPLPAGSKDPGIIRFAQTVKQDILPPGAKSLRQVPRAYSKSFRTKPITEVRLAGGGQKVVQLWQKGVPWPVYVNNGRTQAWLISTGRQ